MATAGWSKAVPIVLVVPATTERRFPLNQRLNLSKRAKLDTTVVHQQALDVAINATRLSPYYLTPSVVKSVTSDSGTMDDLDYVTVEVNGAAQYCHGCQDLTRRLDKAEADARKKEEMQHNLALVRQLAMNLEFQIKLECLHHMSRDHAAAYQVDGKVCEEIVLAKSLVDMLQQVPDKERAFKGKVFQLLQPLRQMKKGFTDNFAHPNLTLDEKPLNFNDCLNLLKITDCVKAEHMELIVDRLKELEQVRKDSGEANMIVKW